MWIVETTLDVPILCTICVSLALRPNRRAVGFAGLEVLVGNATSHTRQRRQSIFSRLIFQYRFRFCKCSCVPCCRTRNAWLITGDYTWVETAISGRHKDSKMFWLWRQKTSGLGWLFPTIRGGYSHCSVVHNLLKILMVNSNVKMYSQFQIRTTTMILESSSLVSSHLMSVMRVERLCAVVSKLTQNWTVDQDQ